MKISLDQKPFHLSHAPRFDMKPQIDFDNNSAVGTHEGSASVDTPTQLSEDFDYAALDSLEDTIRQRIRDGEPFEKLIRELSEAEAELLIIDRLATVIAIIRSAKKPLLYIDALWMLCGSALREGETIISLSKKHGCTKQAFQQATKQIAEKFQLFSKTRTQRSDEAKGNMSASYSYESKAALSVKLA